jgi:hypothetical protein
MRIIGHSGGGSVRISAPLGAGIFNVYGDLEIRSVGSWQHCRD